MQKFTQYYTTINEISKYSYKEIVLTENFKFLSMNVNFNDIVGNYQNYNSLSLENIELSFSFIEDVIKSTTKMISKKIVYYFANSKNIDIKDSSIFLGVFDEYFFYLEDF